MSWEITGNAGTNPSTNFLGTTDGQPLVIKTKTVGSEAMRINQGPGGVEVGIGGDQIVSGPPLSLGIDTRLGGASFVQSLGELRINPYTGSGSNVSIGFKEFVLSKLSAALTVVPLPSQVGIVIGQPDITKGGFTSLSLSISDDSGGHALIQAIKSAGSEYGDLVLNLNGGNVGVGTANPGARLEVSSASGVGIAGTSQSGFGITGTGGNVGVYAHNSTLNPTGTGGIQNDAYLAAPGFAGDFHGNVNVLGNVTVAGDIFLTGAADCAEEFEVAEAVEVEPGTVVVLGQGGTLQHCQQAYDKRVAGVISGAGDYRPGLILDRSQSQDHRVPVALVGKVYCKVDAQYAAIEVGDLLTTSPTLGHAMKADDPLKAFGSVMGKAMHPLKDGQGLIPILIALQ